MADPAAELPTDAVDRDRLLTNVSVQRPATTATTARRRRRDRRPGPPTGVAVFAADNSIRSLLEPTGNIVHWAEFDRGGHFAAMEAPDPLVDDVRSFFRSRR